MTSIRPIEIVGGGLAGLSLGLALRRSQVPVTLFEAGVYPRHRVCGEFITGLDNTLMDRLGLAPLLHDALRHEKLAWYHRGRPVRIQPLPLPARGISRHTLDARLAHAFLEAGGDLRTQTRLADPARPPGRVFATGRHRGASPWLGLKLHAHNLPLACGLELHLGAQAYVGLSQLPGNRVNVCGLFHRREVEAGRRNVLPAYLRAAGLNRLADRLAAASIDPASLCAVAGIRFDRAVTATEPLCVGDACAMIPPFTGNGMAMAFQSAALALDPLLAYARGQSDWPAACRTLQTALRRQFRRRLLSAHFLHPFLLRPVRQKVLAALSRHHLLPLRPLYAALH